MHAKQGVPAPLPGLCCCWKVTEEEQKKERERERGEEEYDSFSEHTKKCRLATVLPRLDA